MNTHTACSVQKRKKTRALSRTPSNRVSLPCSLMRLNRYEPSRADQATVRVVSSRALAVPPPAPRAWLRSASSANVSAPVAS